MNEQKRDYFQPMALEEQANLMEATGLDTLLFCPHPWALRHRFIHRETGDTVPARCGSWSCPYCGPRKVDLWRQLVKAAEPTLFVTLTKVGWTLKEAARTLTTVLQYLRRGRKGRGKKRVGARPAYPVQVFAVLEEHEDFEENGFHWHLLVNGVDFLPYEVVKEALRSATGGRSYIVWVKRVKNSTAVGYVTKYLTKEIMRERRGLVEEEQVTQRVTVDPVEGHVNGQGQPYLFEVRRDEQGQPVLEEERNVVQRLCRAHRIRYSKHFFPTSTAELRRQIFGEKPGAQGSEGAEASEESQEGQEVSQEEQATGSPWMLYEVVSPVEEEQSGGRDRVYLAGVKAQQKKRGLEPDLEASYETRAQRYTRLRREALLEALGRLREGKRLYSRRIIGIWNYQRERLRIAG